MGKAPSFPDLHLVLALERGSEVQETINVQNILVTQANNALTAVQTAGNELHLAQFAKKALDDFQAAEAKVLSGLQAAVKALAQSAEAIAFGAANTVLAFARANVKDIDIAKNAMEKAREASEAALDMGN
ncbi:MAG: hypothetical protein M1824_004340 [Vezdaea acicularis]|nr:MAG: hypothetical protein M1824_004340 [Vezdaea acicularis]